MYGLTWARVARCADLLSVLNVAAKWLKCPTLIKLAEIGVSVEAKGVTRHSACIVLPNSSLFYINKSEFRVCVTL